MLWDGLRKSSDGAQTWSAAVGPKVITDLAFNPLKPETMYLTTSSGLYKSTNAGEHWMQIGQDSLNLASVAVSRVDTNLVLTATSSSLDDFGKLRLSRDGGQTWERLQLPDNDEVSSFASDQSVLGGLRIVSHFEALFTSRVFRSTDFGMNWDEFSGGLPFSRIHQIVLTQNHRQNLLALNSFGIYQLDVITSVQPEPGNQPKDFRLFPVYPNPFSLRTTTSKLLAQEARVTIEYELFSTTEVEIDIYNILGQRVRNLQHSQQTQGRYRLFWNGQDGTGQQVPAGVYFVTISANRRVAVRKVIHLP